MNMLLVACGDTALLVDAGVMFPGPELFGVDLVIPDLSALAAYRGRIGALVLTHGHEDHIGAIAARAFHTSTVRSTASPLTLALVEPKLDEHGIDAEGRLDCRWRPGRRSTVGPFRLEFLRVTHSIPDCLARGDPHAGRRHPAHRRLQDRPDAARRRSPSTSIASPSSARQGVLALLSDSTNADRPGFTGSEREVIEGFEEVFSSAAGKIVVAAFSTSVYRLQLLVNLADQFERKVAFVGRGMQQTSRDRRAARLSEDPAGPADPRQRRRRLSAGGRALPLHRLAGRAAGGPAPHCHRRPPARQAAARRRRRVLGPRHSGQREGGRPGDGSRRPARRRHRVRRPEARPRLGSRQPGRTEIGAVARQAALLRADTR